MKRKTFLKSLGGLAALGLNSFSKNRTPNGLIDDSHLVNGSMIGYADTPISKVRMGIIGLGNRGNTLLEMMQWMVENDRAEITALCDKNPEKAGKAAIKLSNFQKKKAKVYKNGKDDWKNMVKREDIDIVLVCTPWSMHTPMALFSMENGKHVATEVPIAYTLEECWELVKTAERTKRHCIMIENCCYNEEELFVLNMIQNGVFGDLTHAEGAYIHDLRSLLLDEKYYEDQWRMDHHESRDGNFYTTHGLGPISTYMNIGRGDTFDHLTSMSSREKSLSDAANSMGSPRNKIKCGDMNTTLIKTALGKTIMLQFDVHTGSPYSRINKVVGTGAVHDGYPSKLYIDDPNDLKFWGHKWLDQTEYDAYKKKYNHPLFTKLQAISKNFKQGHGGMDFVMMYRLITCLNLGLPLDFNVYDGVMWSAITPLSELSVANKSLPINIPDFTGGTWKKQRDLEIMRNLD